MAFPSLFVLMTDATEDIWSDDHCEPLPDDA
jgi:hypothetical protein